jgi:hypothetical protein
MKFVRICSRPRRDLARGFSYSMGCFGDASEAHAGLSGYEVHDAAEAVELLDERMSVAGARCASRRLGGRDPVMYLAVFEGARVGTGPDGEDLFRPSRLVATRKTREIPSAADALAWLESV